MAEKSGFDFTINTSMYYQLNTNIENYKFHEAKKIGANKQNLAFRNPEWSEMKMDIMEQILRAKLSQHKYIQEKLLESGTHILVEDSPTDAFWGRGPDGNGENQLGKIWMRLRAELLGITNTKSPLG
jgi:ribA/ribD-fused uncharacterized protein